MQSSSNIQNLEIATFQRWLFCGCLLTLLVQVMTGVLSATGVFGAEIERLLSIFNWLPAFAAVAYSSFRLSKIALVSVAISGLLATISIFLQFMPEPYSGFGALVQILSHAALFCFVASIILMVPQFLGGQHSTKGSTVGVESNDTNQASEQTSHDNSDTSKKETNADELFSLREELANRKETERLMLSIADGTKNKYENEFFDALVENLSRAFNCQTAVVTKLSDSNPSQLETLSICHQGKKLDNVKFNLVATPCQETLKGHPVFYNQDLTTLFPKAEIIKTLGAESYAAYPMFDSDEKPVGHIAIMDPNPLDFNESNHQLLRIFAIQARTEIERIQWRELLAKKDAELLALVEKSEVLFASVGEDRTVKVFNQQAVPFLAGDTSRESDHVADDFFRGHDEILAGIESAFEGSIPDPITIQHQDKFLQTQFKEIHQDRAKQIVLVCMDISQQERSKQLVERISSETSKYSGSVFFRELVRNISISLDVSHVLITECCNNKSSLQTLALWNDGQFGENFVYETDGTPCQFVWEDREFAYYPDQVQEKFPFDKDLKEQNLESYFALPLISRNNQVLGNLVILNHAPMHNFTDHLSALKLFAERAASELEQMRAQRAILDQEAAYRDLLMNYVDGLFLVVDEKIVLANRQANQKLGYENEELHGHNILELICPDDLEKSKLHFDSILNNQPGLRTAQINICRSDETRFPAELSAQVVEYLNQNAALFVMRDISARYHAEEQLQDLRQQMAHVNRVSTMGEMASGLAHEINQPLTAIANFAAVAIEDIKSSPYEPSDTLSTSLNRISNQAVRAGDIIRNLRGFIGKRQRESEYVDIVKLVEQVIAMFQTDIRTHNVDLQLNHFDTMPKIRVNSVQIQQVLVNLLRNSFDAISQQNNKRLISISIRLETRFLKIHVTDNGPGFPENQDIFSAYSTEKKNGLGLGLAISRTIVESHGGKLWGTNLEEGGARFTFEIPLEGRVDNNQSSI